ncbi:hypothetical protein [Halopiger xanaduensis]|uniref:Uncharacterized protein n=1 Tax=Halopiger xanaduensis (strain DSM 18323 / JCM 14033 / SH-6) TaxID=797210 RepID=F8D9H9_HALXS|nr:hypothetical protein [Halopiger xanaduensis]AEH38065.1 hypothetical protein Halxa_3454 [Halopiger xanaduensis SH-6]
MRVSVPGLPGVYYDTDAGTTALTTVFSVAGRRAPKPKGYALQALPYLWSFEVDLQEVPNDHPLQYLHPEGARSLSGLSPEDVPRTQQGLRTAGTELEAVFRFVWEVNREVESAANRVLGTSPDDEGVVIEIQDGAVNVGGEELETDEFDIDEGSAGEPVDSGSEADAFDAGETTVEFDESGDGTDVDPDADESDSNGYDTGDEL